jgi:hypothetical protein
VFVLAALPISLELLHDVKLADDLFGRAVERAADNPDLVAAMIDGPLRAGHAAQAKAMADRARELGIADITIHPTAPAGAPAASTDSPDSPDATDPAP